MTAAPPAPPASRPGGKIYLFDSLQLIPAGGPDTLPLPVRSTKLQALLAYLILRARAPVDRRKLGGILWPRSTESAARRNLREYLYRARQLLAEFSPAGDLLSTEENHLTFTPSPDCRIDALEFDRLLDQAARPNLPPTRLRPLLQQAVDLYRGDLLANLYDDWLAAERARFKDRYIAALGQLSRALQTEGNLPQAIAAARRWLNADPLQEEAHRHLMALYVAGGDRASALHQYRLCAQTLAEELAAEPMPETEALYRAILEEAAAPHPPAPSHPGDAAPPLMGRQVELGRLSLALTRVRLGQCRFITLTGEAGSGKTRLAAQWLATLPPDTLILKGQAFELEHDIPYRPLLDALQPSLSRLPWDTLPGPPSPPWLAPLAQLLPDLYYHLPGLPPDVPAPPQKANHSIAEAIAQLLAGLTRRSPVVLFVDDLQWADASTWQCLSFLPRRAEHSALLVLGAFAPSEAPPGALARLQTLQQRGLMQLLPLPPLTADDTAELARQTLTLSSEEAADLAGWLHRHTGGNPFLTVETLHNLRRSSLAPPYRTHRLEQLPLPDLVQRHLQNRLERLPPSSRRALLAASVIGRPFTFRLLETLTHLDADALLEYLESWLARGLLVEESTGCYNFATPCLQRAAYNSLSRPRRRQSHYRLARALENTPPVDAGLVAHHYRLAGHPQQA